MYQNDFILLFSTLAFLLQSLNHPFIRYVFFVIHFVEVTHVILPEKSQRIFNKRVPVPETWMNLLDIFESLGTKD